MIAIAVGIFIFIIGMLVVNILMPEVTRARNASNLNCTNPTSDGTRLTCLAVDVVIPYFIITILSVTGGMITARFLV